MLYEEFINHHHSEDCMRSECVDRKTAYENLIKENSLLMDRFNELSNKLKDVTDKLELQKVRNGQLSMDNQTLTKKIDNQRKSNKQTLESYEFLLKLNDSLEAKNEKMKKNMESYNKLTKMIRESKILSE